MADEEESFESLLNKATNPSNQTDDWDTIKAYSSKINAGGDMQQTALRLIAHKMQSPQEKEALQALTVLEHCACDCDRRFHDEIGKFRFLNEMIKLVSPKYLGNRTSLKVKIKVIEIMYKWTHQLRYETKIIEAYQMLKQQGVVTEDPTYLDEANRSPQPRPKNALFEDDEKAKLLQKLLQSKNPQDLQAANRLIKNMVKEDEKRVEKMSRRSSELETVNNNVKVLSEMLANYAVTPSKNEDVDLMKELYESCERLRPNLFRLASEVDEKEEGMADILRANDELSRVMALYKKMVEGCEEISDLNPGQMSLLDLGSPECNGRGAISELSILDDQLIGLSIGEKSTTKIDLKELDDIFSSSTNTPGSMLRPLQPIVQTVKPIEPVEPVVKAKGLQVLDEIGQSLLKQSLPPTIEVGAEFAKISDKIPLNKMKTNSIPGSPRPESPRTPIHELISINDIYVPFESIKASDDKPMTLHDRNDVTVLLHFTTNKPRDDVRVFVVTTLSKNSSKSVKNITFQAVVTKMTKVKLQPPSATSLPAFNPILPPSAVTQIMLLANPRKEKIRLKYKIGYSLDDRLVSEEGEIDGLPEMT